MDRLDQGHLYPNLEVPGIKPRPPAWEASSLEKSHLNSLFMAIRNYSATYEPTNGTPWLLPAHVVQSAMNQHGIASLGCSPYSTFKSFNPEY